jgi:outer membrane protein
MSRLLTRVLFAALVLPVFGMSQTSTPAAASQSSAAVPAAKIGWIIMEPAILSSEDGKKMFADIQKFVDDKNNELDKMRKDLDSLKSQLSVQGSKLTDEARAEAEDNIEAKDTAIQRFSQDTQKEIEARRSKTANFVARKMQPIIEKVAKEKGLNAVQYFNNSRDAWIDPSLNITEEVVKAYNAQYPAGAAKSPAAPAKKQ